MDLDHHARLSFCGHLLNVEERSGLEVAMTARSLREGLDRMFFWGKIIGSDGSYLVCYALLPDSDGGVPAKKFYYACVGRAWRLDGGGRRSAGR